MSGGEILTVQHLTVKFTTKYGTAAAVSDVSFSLHKGEILGLVGESGSGKSVTSKALMRLLPEETARISGHVLLDGTDLLQLTEKQMADFRGNRISMIFQEPMVSLNPLFTIGDQLTEVLRRHRRISGSKARMLAAESLERVGIPSPAARLKQYPFELSGGLRQRVMIAMALLCEPEVLIADEPTTALDVTIQAQILELLKELNRDLGISIILITHDMGVIAETAHTVAVMYGGRIAEMSPVRPFFREPLHPYSEGLLHSIPDGKGGKGPLATIPGSVPGIYQMPKGCPFRDRCRKATTLCAFGVPALVRHGEGLVACHLYDNEEIESAAP